MEFWKFQILHKLPANLAVLPQISASTPAQYQLRKYVLSIGMADYGKVGFPGEAIFAKQHFVSAHF